MTDEELNEIVVKLRDTIARLGELIAIKLDMGAPYEDILDTHMAAISIHYAASCASLVYKDSHYAQLKELADRVLFRCSKFF